MTKSIKAKVRKGHVCPDCAVPMHVYWVRHPSIGLTVRGRKCPACGKGVRTEERKK